jgi:ribosomal protein S21
MLIIKVEKGNLERALKMYKSKVIKTRQMSELNMRKTFVKDSVKNREMMKKAKYVQQKYKSNED